MVSRPRYTSIVPVALVIVVMLTGAGCSRPAPDPQLVGGTPGVGAAAARGTGATGATGANGANGAAARPLGIAPAVGRRLPAALPDDADYPEQDCAGPPRQSGWVAAENNRPGSAWTSGPATGRVVRPVIGYLSRSSAVCGEVVEVSLSGQGAGQGTGLRLAAYRIGWYHGVGSRLLWQSDPLAVTTRPVPTRAAVTRLVEPAWPSTVRLTITPDWPPGLYALVPVRGSVAAGPMIPLVIRDDAGTEPVLFMASTLTWQAYNTWGGWSLYAGPVGTSPQRSADRARVVSLNRPLGGAGLDQFQYMDLPVARWAESLGVDVGYTTDAAVDAWPSRLLRHGELLVGGHSEYWTTRMYDAAEAATAAGVNLVLLGANNLWWHARLEAAADGARTRLAVYRVAAQDPLAATEPDQSTVLWTKPPLLRDASELTGESHAAIGVQGGLQLLSPPDWFVAGTGLHPGSLLPGAVGNEADGYHPLAIHPQAVQVLAYGVLDGRRGPVTVSTNYAVLDGGAAVFTAGTTDWACELGTGCPGHPVAPATRTAVRGLTRNVVLALADPVAGQRHPATGTVPPPAAVARRSLPAAARGSYGDTRQTPDKD